MSFDDAVYDLLKDHFGDPSNSFEVGRLRKAGRLIAESLRYDLGDGCADLGLVERTLRARLARYKKVFPGIAPTALGLAANWSTTRGPYSHAANASPTSAEWAEDGEDDEATVSTDMLDDLNDSMGRIGRDMPW